MTRCIVLNIARAAAVAATVALAVASAALAQTAEPPATSASAPQVSSVPAPLRAAFQAELSGAVSDWARATTPRDKFAAAYRRAGALAGLHRWIGAHGWLRIAAQLAPDDAARALVAQSYRALRRKSPLRIDLAFRITPSSNVNNGSAHTHYLNWQLPNTDQALSGTTYGLYGQLGWRIAQDRHRQRTLRLRAGASRVRLDSAPAGVDDADYAQSHLGLSIVTQARPTPRLRTTTEIAVLRLWRAQTPFETRATWDWTSTRHLGPQTTGPSNTLGTGVSVRLATRPSGEGHSYVGAHVSGGWHTGVGPVHLRLGAARSLSDTAYLDYHELDARVTWQPRLDASPNAGADTKPDWQPSLTLGLTGRWHDDNIYTDTPRRDGRLSLRAATALPQWETYGFTPIVALTASRNRSNVAVYETEQMALGITLQSAF